MIRCDKCGWERPNCSVANCKHPAVNKVFGSNVCMYCCKGCKFHKELTIKEHGLSGVQCGYKKEEGN